MYGFNFFTLGFDESYIFYGLIVGILLGLYLFFRTKGLFEYYNISRKVKNILRIIIFIVTVIILSNPWSSLSVIVFYICISSIIADVIYFIYKILLKSTNETVFSKFYKSGVFFVIIFVIVMAISAYGMYNVVDTNYHYTTDKTNNSYTIVFISDLHYDTIQNTGVVNDSIKKINDLHPDIVILGGDILDERTSNESMHEIFNSLGKINATYGVFFIYGNHDTQPYILDYNQESRTFSNADLENTINSNGIKILSDEKVDIGDDLSIVGRADAGYDESKNKERMSANELLNNTNTSKYNIVIDHQPIDQENVSKQGVDLMISGHTHGGQIFPYNVFGKAMGVTDYGETHFGNLTQIVSSGLSGWGFPIRNVAHCEFVTIRIN